LRQAGPEDEPLLFALFFEVKAVDLAATGLAEAQFLPLIEMQYRGREMTYEVQYPKAESLILIGEDGKPAGRLLLDRGLDRWRVVDITVLASHRRSGIGTRVLTQCQEQCSKAGVRLELQVSAGSPALRLYERLGFQITHGDGISVEMVWSPSQMR
jgi:ribosomal protein S18 acetylase RimI-like enzyme